MSPDDKNRFARGFGEGYSYVAVGFQLAAVILLFGGLGWMVDGWLHTRPCWPSRASWSAPSAGS